MCLVVGPRVQIWSVGHFGASRPRSTVLLRRLSKCTQLRQHTDHHFHEQVFRLHLCGHTSKMTFSMHYKHCTGQFWNESKVFRLHKDKSTAWVRADRQLASGQARAVRLSKMLGEYKYKKAGKDAFINMKHLYTKLFGEVNLSINIVCVHYLKHVVCAKMLKVTAR